MGAKVKRPARSPKKVARAARKAEPSTDAADLLAVREDPLLWFQGFGYWRDEQTRESRRGPANIYQKRIAEHVRYCMERNIPCRIAGIKYRRAGSSTISNAILHHCAMNFTWRCAVIGTDYKASSNMLEMLKHFAEHDNFPGWHSSIKETDKVKVGAAEWTGEDFAVVPLEERVDRMIATRVEYAHGSSVEMYTSKNPESSRSAGLNFYLATEPGRWATGGQQDASETLLAMRNSLPKAGFHVSIEESTANGAQGAFYETCRNARWPSYAKWWKKWETEWPLEESEYGVDLQPVLIFGAWFEDSRHVDRKLTAEQEARLKDSLDDRERMYIERYAEDGPRGQRLGSEVDATVWQQLAWRRAIIKNVCTRGGADEFDQEYPHSPKAAFLSSGSPALDPMGVLELEMQCRGKIPEYGQLSCQRGRENNLRGLQPWEVSFHGREKEQAVIEMWEHPHEGLAYLVSADCMSGAEQITGTGEKDRHAVFVFRRAYQDTHGAFHRTRVVARIKAPCQWEEKPLARMVYLLAAFYGNATVVPEVEGGCGTALAQDLLELGANLYQWEEFDSVRQKTTMKIGWRTTSASRPIAIENLRHYVREQLLELHCPHAVGELAALVINSKGKAEASSGRHDDDAMSLAIGLSCIDQARVYPKRAAVRLRAPDEARWKPLR